MSKNVILELSKISYQTMNLLGTKEVDIIKEVDGKFYEGEITGIIGKSGAGKSCLLRLIAGLLQRTSGEMLFNVSGKKPEKVRTSMVFQDFALFPWLNVKENIELGVSSLNLAVDETNARVEDMIELIGLDGFAESYPKELSGGMKQRVGFARALVSEPDILLMDEPFSSLDILTAEALRSDFIDLWRHNLLPIKAAIMVTHDIGDLLSMCDRVHFMAGGTGQFYHSEEIDLKHPRNEESKEYREAAEKIYGVIFDDLDHDYTYRKGKELDYNLFVNIARVTISELTGFIDLLNSPAYGGKADIIELSEELNLDADAIGACLELAEALSFTKREDTQVKLTAIGKKYAAATPEIQQQLLSGRMSKYVGLVTEFEKLMTAEKSKEKGLKKLEEKISAKLDKEKTQQVMQGLLNWVKFFGL